MPTSKTRSVVRASVVRLEKPYGSERVKFKVEFQIGGVSGCASGGCPTTWTLRSASAASAASRASITQFASVCVSLRQLRQLRQSLR